MSDAGELASAGVVAMNGEWDGSVSAGSDSVEGVSDSVLDRRAFLVRVALFGVEVDLGYKVYNRYK